MYELPESFDRLAVDRSVVGGRARPAEEGRPQGSAAGEIVVQVVVVDDAGQRVAEGVDVARRAQDPGVADDLGHRRRPTRPRGSPGRAPPRPGARSPRTSREGSTPGPGGRANRGSPSGPGRGGAHPAGRGLPTSPQPGGPTITSVRSRPARRRVTASAATPRSLRGSTVPTERMNGCRTPTISTSRSTMSSGIGSGGSQPSGAMRNCSCAKPSSSNSSRVNNEGAMTSCACSRASSKPRRWKATPRRVVARGMRTNAMSCTVTTNGRSRTGGIARLGAWTMSALIRNVGRRSRCHAS